MMSSYSIPKFTRRGRLNMLVYILIRCSKQIIDDVYKMYNTKITMGKVFNAFIKFKGNLKLARTFLMMQANLADVYF